MLIGLPDLAKEIPISITIFFARAQLQNSVSKPLDTKRNTTQTLKEKIRGFFDELFAGCLEKLLSFSKYFSSNTFSQNIKY